MMRPTGAGVNWFVVVNPTRRKSRLRAPLIEFGSVIIRAAAARLWRRRTLDGDERGYQYGKAGM